MTQSTVTCKIEHHAVMFALLSKYAELLAGEEGKKVIQDGMIAYGHERGARMAANAKSHGDAINVLSNQVYGEWIPDYEGQMDSGFLSTEPTLQTYVKKCAWCDAWKKHDLLEYGKYYCVNVDKSVYEGFCPDFACRLMTTTLSFGGDCCEFDWGQPLTAEDIQTLIKKKEELGNSCVKDFTFHTAHILHTVGNTLKDKLGDKGEEIVQKAVQEYIERFGEPYFTVLEGLYNDDSLF